MARTGIRHEPAKPSTIRSEGNIKERQKGKMDMLSTWKGLSKGSKDSGGMYKPMAVMTAIPIATIKITTIMMLMMTIKKAAKRNS